MLLEGRERFEEESLHDLREGSLSCASGLTGISNFGLLILIGSINIITWYYKLWAHFNLVH